MVLLTTLRLSKQSQSPGERKQQNISQTRMVQLSRSQILLSNWNVFGKLEYSFAIQAKVGHDWTGLFKLNPALNKTCTEINRVSQRLLLLRSKTDSHRAGNTFVKIENIKLITVFDNEHNSMSKIFQNQVTNFVCYDFNS